MRVLFIGGTGLISSASTSLLIEREHDLTLVTRGTSAKAAIPQRARAIVADALDAPQLRAALARDVAAHGEYDAVVQWIGFSPDHISDDIITFANLTKQYVFISSASAYQTPPKHYVVSEDTTALHNPFWQYSRDKAESEYRLRIATAESGFPATVVRPSHTYGYAEIPAGINSWTKPWTWADRLLRGAPMVAHGDGASLWTLTDHRDFAVGLVGLLGNDAAIGTDFHITSDDVLSWNQIHEYIAGALGVSDEQLAEQTVHIPSTLLARFNQEAFEGPLLGDKTNAGIFDNAKLRAIVPDFATRHHFADAIHESVAWFRADPARQGIDDAANALWDDVAARYMRGIEAMFA